MRSQMPPDDIDMGAVLSAIRKALPKALLTGALLGGLTAAAFMTMAPKYASQATVEIVSRPMLNPLNPGTGTEQRAEPDREAVGTHVRKLLSNDIAVPLVRDLGLTSRPEFNEALPPVDLFTRLLRVAGVGMPKTAETDEDRALAAFRQAMKVAQLRDTRNIQIEFTTSNPVLSARGANRIAELYRYSLTDTRKDETADLRDKLKVEVERLSREVADADNRVTEFRGQRDLFKGGQSSTPLKEQQLALLTEELTKASTAREEAQTRATAAREQLRSNTAEGNPDVQKSPIIPRLSEQRIRLERQISELATTLLPAHPRMRQLQGDLGALKRQIIDEVRKVIDALERDGKIAGDREQGVQKRIDGLKSSVTTSAPDDARLRGLEDQAKAKRAEAERVQQAYQKAVSTQTTGDAPVEVKIVQRAIPSTEKVWPKTWLAGLVGLAGLLTVLFLVMTRALIAGPGRHTIGSVLKTDPTVVRLDASPGSALAPRLTRAEPTSGVNRTATTTTTAVAAALMRRPGNAASCRTLVAGARVGFAPDPDAFSLARALAMAGNAVVLVDWSADTTRLQTGVTGSTAPGLADLVRGEAAIEEVIQRLADTEIHVLPAGRTGGDVSDLFDADRANLVLDALDEAYQHIIVMAGYQAARDLFQAVQGRFDVGVSVGDGSPVGRQAGFLGFDVPDLERYAIERRPTAVPVGRKATLIRSSHLAAAHT